MAAEGDVIIFIFTGVEGEVIPRNATRFIAHESVTVIPARLFQGHPNIVELICHAGVIRIEQWAFYYCPNLRRVIIPGVKIVEGDAFFGCGAVTYIECNKLERIEGSAFSSCKSLSNISLPSTKVVQNDAFYNCVALMDVKFGKSLESIRSMAFMDCRSLERITIPLKDDIISEDYIFQRCDNLKSVDLVEEAALRETIAALLLEEWRNDMSALIESINQILPNTYAGGEYDAEGKALAIREWSASVLRKIIRYKAHHQSFLNDAATLLTHTLPNDIVMNNIIAFLHLPAHTFEGENHEEDSSTSSDDYNDESYDTSDGGDGDYGDEDDNNNDG